MTLARKKVPAAMEGWRLFFLLAAGILFFRIAAVILAWPELGPDETQYWFWAQSPAMGYFSKPPLIAWAIAATTGVFGDSAWAVRLSAPIFQTGAAVFIYLLARRLFGPIAAFWSGLAWLTLPGVSLSSALMTTDAPLLFFWSAALYFFHRLADDRGGLAVAAALGVVVGLGFLSKYAMIYFLIGAGFTIVASSAQRSPRALAGVGVALSIAALIIAPNFIWNAENDFQTVAHTAANANWQGTIGRPVKMLEFVGGQFGVAGPIAFSLMAIVAWRSFRDRPIDRDRLFLLAFAAPPLLIVTAQSFLSRAHANWAAAAYPSLVILIAGALAARRPSPVFKAAVGFNAFIAAVAAIAFTNMHLVDAAGFGPAFKRLRGWEAQGETIAAAASGLDAIMADDREILGGIVYYARKSGLPVVAWNSNDRIDHHYEAFHPYAPQTAARILYVTRNAEAVELADKFRLKRPIGATTVETGAGGSRTLYLFELSDFEP